ncbi:MAG: hypothetical protein FJZ62_05295 [Chlamydiae bacterium]|nr:hypothetical protein [Chlamydiota bacterium]
MANYFLSIFGLFLINLVSIISLEAKEKRALVVILSQTREGNVTFESLKKNVLDPLEADLAVCIGVKDGQTPQDPIFQNAKYRFCYPEPEDYATAFDEASTIIQFQNPEIEKPFDWRKFLKIKDQFLGGIKDPHDEHPGSAGILIFFRWFLLQNILQEKLLDKYDFFVITRSDHLYLLPHPSLQVLGDEKISIPLGQGYGGFTDRHVVLPKKFVVPYLDILNKMITKGANYTSRLKLKKNWNLERFIKFHLHQHGLIKYVQYFLRNMYTMRSIGGTTRWVPGDFSEEHGYFLKYPKEYQDSMENRSKFEKSKDTLDNFYKANLFDAYSYDKIRVLSPGCDT